MSAPLALTIDRLDEKKELILAQSTSQCCRTGCCQPSINWVINEGDNYAGGNPHDLPHSGWIHEESTWSMRCLSGFLPGCRPTKYVQHSSEVPDSIVSKEDNNWCTCQCETVTKGLTEKDMNDSVVATHEKGQTCGACCCSPAPFLETKDAEGKTIGKTTFVCDGCIFVPKFDVTDANGDKIYRLRPDTCVAGCCVQCRCGGPKGKCCRVPYIVRDPNTLEPIMGRNEEKAQVTQLFAGWKNECCTKRNAYHLVFPSNATNEQKLTLIGSSIILDVLFAEQDDDSS